jgi:hypothetical protein
MALALLAAAWQPPLPPPRALCARIKCRCSRTDAKTEQKTGTVV